MVAPLMFARPADESRLMSRIFSARNSTVAFKCDHDIMRGYASAVQPKFRHVKIGAGTAALTAKRDAGVRRAAREIGWQSAMRRR